MNYKELAEQALDYIVEQRRWCHQNPELSLEEVQTTEHIAAELQKMGYTEIQRFPDHTGLCAMLRPKRRAELWLSGRILMPCR